MTRKTPEINVSDLDTDSTDQGKILSSNRILIRDPKPIAEIMFSNPDANTNILIAGTIHFLTGFILLIKCNIKR